MKTCGRGRRGGGSQVGERAAVVPPGVPAKAPFVRRVGSCLGVPDAMGVHGRRCWDRGRFHTDRRLSGLRARTEDTPADQKVCDPASRTARRALSEVRSILSPPPLAPTFCEGRAAAGKECSGRERQGRVSKAARGRWRGRSAPHKTQPLKRLMGLDCKPHRRPQGNGRCSAPRTVHCRAMVERPSLRSPVLGEGMR